LLNHGLFRVFLPWPPRDASGQAIRPEFTLELLRDPTGCNSDPRHGLRSATPMVSVYRRPRIAANLTRPGLIVMADGRAPTLAAQAADATATHMQRREPLTAGQLQDMVDFESQVSVSQTQPRRGTEESVERGRQLFAQREFRKPGSTTPQTCAGCHAAVTQDADTTTYPSEPPDTGLPLFRIRCGKSPPLYTQDPGRALVTGRCADVGALVTQALPGIASHPPYFANGMAGTLRDVVVFYDRRYGMGLSPAEMDDLANYLGSL
jgi:cytochrome c peroxidase